MKLIKSSFTILEPQGYDTISIKKFIEAAARVCYKSEDKITDESYQVMYDSLVKRGHTAMLEHGTVYLTIPSSEADCVYKYLWNNYSEVIKESDYTYVTTNMRVLEQNSWMRDLRYATEPTKHVRRVTVKFICDRGVSHEFVRHRVFSFAQSSTRFCNYAKGKFGSELTFIIPSWMDIPEMSIRSDDGIYIETEGYSISDFERYLPQFHLLANIEGVYLDMISEKYQPQQARQILPNALMTELIMTGTISQWEGFFVLRDDKAAHPDARALAAPLHKEFIKRGYLDK